MIKNTVFLLFILSFLSCKNDKKKSESNYTIPLLTLSDTTLKNFTANDKKIGYKIIISNEASGFGYDIYKNDKKYIHQGTIPAVKGFIAFKNEKEAIKIAELVVKKLLQNEGLPTIELNDLDSLQISY